MTERKFAARLRGTGSAAAVREAVKQDIRESTVLTKTKLVEPLDYETVIVKNKTILQNDPLREMLLFPHDDVSMSELARRVRTIRSSVPQSALSEAQQLLTKECIKSYMSKWQVVHFKYSGYSGNFQQLPKVTRTTVLPPQIFEIDHQTEVGGRDEDRLMPSRHTAIVKKGWLLKGPDSTHEASLVNFSRSFKRRYFYLKQQADNSYVLEYHKDDKKLETKGSIFFDSAAEVNKSVRRAKLSFEIVMQDKRFYVFGADSEAELDEWVSALNKVIQSNDPNQAQLDRSRDKEFEIPGRGESLRDSLEYSMNPELQKYARETDTVLAQQRKDGRNKIFSLYSDIQKKLTSEDRGSGGGGGGGDDLSSYEGEVYKEQFGTCRFIVQCSELKLRLQANIADDGQPEKQDNPEPFFLTLALYDAREAKKISEDFHVDLNSPEIRAMIASEYSVLGGGGTTGGGSETPAAIISNGTNNRSSVSRPPGPPPPPPVLDFIQTAVFSVSKPSPDVFLVAHIDKILQGSVSAAQEQYRTTDVKAGTKVHRTVRQFCQRLGHYHMPFAWAARPLFKKYHQQELDTNADFVVYKSESSRMCEEEMIRTLQDMRKADRQMRIQPFQGLVLKVSVTPLNPNASLPNTLTSSLIPLRPYDDKPAVAREIDEFVLDDGQYAFPHTTYLNHLYIHPRQLKYDGQKSYPKARNIACCVEFRDSDSEGATSLKIIYGQPGTSTFTTTSMTTVLHHNTVPEFIDEVKMCLPTHLHDRHHLVFTFYHVSCDPIAKGTSKKVQSVETIVGYAWFPLLVNGRVNVGEQFIRVATNLPSSYLSSEQGRGSISGAEIKWVDGGKQLFKFNLSLVSTIYTKDPHLHSFFTHCQKLEALTSDGTVDPSPRINPRGVLTSTNGVGGGGVGGVGGEERGNISLVGGAAGMGGGGGDRGSKFDKNKEEMLNVVKSLLAADVPEVIHFLPALLTQLLCLLTRTTSEEVTANTVRALIHVVHEVHDAGKTGILHSYVKYVFLTESVRQRTVHEELAQQLKATLRPNTADQTVVSQFLKHSWFFFDVLIKSMAQHLITTERIKMARNERFPASYQENINSLTSSVCMYIVQRFKEAGSETRSANLSLANFIKKCFTFMDRGFVFRLIKLYIESLQSADAKTLHEYKFEFLRTVCSHEHYVPLNLPLIRKQVRSYKDLKHDYTLSEEFQQNHFLVGLLLSEVKTALNEVHDTRKFAIATLRNLLAKHSFDDRYTSKSHQARIVALYLPLISILIENKTRLSSPHPDPHHSSPNAPPPPLSNGYGSEFSADSAPASRTNSTYTSQLSLDQASLSSGISSASQSQRPTRVDPNVFNLISGKVSSIPIFDGTPQLSHHGSQSSLNSSASMQSGGTEKGSDTSSARNWGSKDKCESICSDIRPGSMIGGGSVSMVTRYDKLDQSEIKDLLLCFLYIVKNLSEEVILGWFNNSSEFDVLDFLAVLEISMQQFKYAGKKRITSLCIIGDSRKSVTFPVGGRRQGQTAGRVTSLYGVGGGESALDASLSLAPNHSAKDSEGDGLMQAMIEANLSVEVSMIVLDIVALYVDTFKEQLQYTNGDNVVMHKVFDLYLSFIQTCQSETVHSHAFAAIRSFINKFPTMLFQGQATVCGRLCYEILRCCSSRLDVTRTEACALMYLFMRKNFEFSKLMSFTRVHLQMIISVSQLMGNGVIISSSRFAESLSIISSYASNDKAMQRTVFPMEVKDLMKCIRTVLMATAQMKEHSSDPEKYVDLQYSLAKSYTSMPELRKTWLESMAKRHSKNGDYSEAAHCYIHIAALVAEYLKRRGEFPQGCTVFKSISPNAEAEESGMRDDSGMQDVAYTENNLIELLEECAHMLEKAERYELLGEIYRFIIPIYEKKRDFERLAAAYEILHRAYAKIVDVMSTGKRMLGKYYRVAFYGQLFFEDEDGKVYIYKEPKVTGLPEICDRLRTMYSTKYGTGNVKLIMDSNKVNRQELDPKIAYIQVTYVTPYFDERELKERQTDFERNNNIRRFMFETPFTKDGKSRGEIEEQYRRQTILTASHSFPYVKKRISVVYDKEEVLSPIEVAIDEMKKKVAELTEVVCQRVPDIKRLQLQLQGSVSVTVNAGPLAYAIAFLSSQKILLYKRDHVETLKEHFRSFVSICSDAVVLNAHLVSADQIEYHESLRKNFTETADKLAEIFGESATTSATSEILNYCKHFKIHRPPAKYWKNCGFVRSTNSKLLQMQ